MGKNFGGISNDRGYLVAVDSQGNVYVAGIFYSPQINFGGPALIKQGNGDLFLAKFTPSGEHLWSKSFGHSNNTIPDGLTVDSQDNVLLTGNFNGPQVQFGGDGHINVGLIDIFLVKFNSSGEYLWSQSFGGRQRDYPTSITTDNEDNVYLTGYFFSPELNLGGPPLELIGFLSPNIFLAKFTGAGEHEWSKSFHGVREAPNPAVATDRQGHLYLTGSFGSYQFVIEGTILTSKGQEDIFLAKFTQAGEYMWSKSFGHRDGDYPTDIAVDPYGDVYLTGHFYSVELDLGGGSHPAPGKSHDGFIAQYTPDGEHIWSTVFGGGGEDKALSVAISPKGSPYITGHFNSSEITLGGQILTQKTYFDFFLVKYQ